MYIADFFKELMEWHHFVYLFIERP